MGGPSGQGGPGMMGGPEGMSHHHGGPRGMGRMGPEDMAKFAERRIDYVIKEVGGTPEQKDKLLAIAKATAADMKPLREQHMQARQKAFGLLAAPTVDRAALEQLRASEMAAADAMSKRMVQSMADSAEVLKPEQRAKLAESMKKRMEGRGKR
jgi:Spy/CpxP family protein refolding chaperone